MAEDYLGWTKKEIMDNYYWMEQTFGMFKMRGVSQRSIAVYNRLNRMASLPKQSPLSGHSICCVVLMRHICHLSAAFHFYRQASISRTPIQQQSVKANALAGIYEKPNMIMSLRWRELTKEFLIKGKKIHGFTNHVMIYIIKWKHTGPSVYYRSLTDNWMWWRHIT